MTASTTSFEDARPRMRRATLVGALGTLPEWYDYGIYGTASALYIGPLFFGSQNPTVQLLASFATFAIGYLARPLGGIILGHVGDRYGRKRVLLLTISIMAASTFLIGCLPTVDQVGALAPALLVLLRLIQGFGAGAELAGALTFVSESSVPRRRAFATSFMGASSYAGILLGTLTFAVLNGLLPHVSMLAWGWRVPFLASLLVVIVPLVMRFAISDTQAYRSAAELARASGNSRPPLVELLRGRKLAILAGFLSLATVSFTSYVVAVFALGYLVGTVKVDPQIGLIAILIAGCFSIPSALVFGRLADRIGARRVIVIGAVGSAAFAFPFFLLLDSGNIVMIVIAIAVGYALSFGTTSGAQGLLLPSLFATSSRLSGVAISRELSSALVGGPAALVATALVVASGGAPWLVAVAVVLASVLTILGVIISSRVSEPETTRPDDPKPIAAES